ncbi:MAG: methyltransferase, TIGR04325 family [Myxococcales bacterium]
MNDRFLASFKRWSPPAVYDAVKWTFGTHFAGDYASWAQARENCTGYDGAAILRRVVETTRDVVAGRVAAERDAIPLPKVEYSWPLLASLLFVACQEAGALRVADFGGSLGSTYRQNLRFLTGIKQLSWAVVEQPDFIAAGKREFENETLKFFDTLEAAFEAIRPNVVLLSGVIQYLEQPHAMLDRIFALKPSFVVLDRTPLIDAPKDRLTVQTVSKRIYPGSYPAWFFARGPLLKRFEADYELIEMFESGDRANISSQYVGGLFKRR